MEKKKQTGRLSYSTSGKRVRGFLCMLTFCVLVINTTFTIWGFRLYGTDILIDPKEQYMESATYQTDFSNSVRDVLRNLEDIYLSTDSKVISIMDVGNEMTIYCNILQMRADWEDKEPKDLVSYIQMQAEERGRADYVVDLSNYEAVLQYLEWNPKSERYLFFDKQAFKTLFKDCGYQNVNHRFSDAFSPNSYFVFCYDEGDGGVLIKDKIENLSDTEQIDIEDTTYAVYDEEQNVFWQSAGESFEPMDYYLYDVQEVASVIGLEDENEDDAMGANNFDSIVLPLLWCNNLNDGNFYEHLIGRHPQIQTAFENLGLKYDSVTAYWLENSQFADSNVGDETQVTKLDYSYAMAGSDVKNLKEVNGDVSNLVNYEAIKEVFENFPDDTVFYFGFNPANAQNGEDTISRKYQCYSTFAEGIRWCMAGAVAAFLLLMVQAVWLIRTTGKKEKDASQITLNRFDQLPIEIWWIFVLTVMAICFVNVLDIKNVAWNLGMYREYWNLWFAKLILHTLPFAFFFMIFTLSFVRRRRARNRWSTSLIRKAVRYRRYGRTKDDKAETKETGKTGKRAVHKLQRTVVEFRKAFRNLKGTYKLLLAFTIYAGLSGGCLLVAAYGGFHDAEGSLAIFIYVVLQLAAFAVVGYIIKDTNRLIQGVQEITKGNLDSKVKVNRRTSLYKELSDGINHIGDGLKVAVETSIKDERMKTELITNVSHDLKTPLTSIINYVALLKKEEMPTEDAKHYLEVLEAKSMRLKHLTEDLVEAAKATSGNIELEKMPLAFDELMKQAIGEWEDKFEARNLTIVVNYTKEPTVILADGRRMFRIIENVLENAYKYALEGTRIYVELSKDQGCVIFTLKNISAAPLNISTEELMERFTRGDSSRTTEGSGLGLSIARDLTKLQGGTFEIVLDGDLFKVIITFPEHLKDVL